MREMNPRERILASRLIKRIDKNDYYSSRIGLSYEIVDRDSKKIQVSLEEKEEETKKLPSLN